MTAKVLEEKRDAAERPVGQLRRCSLVARFLKKRRDHGVEPWVDVLNAGNGGVYQFERRCFPRAYQGGLGQGVEVGELVSHNTSLLIRSRNKGSDK